MIVVPLLRNLLKQELQRVDSRTTELALAFRTPFATPFVAALGTISEWVLSDIPNEDSCNKVVLRLRAPRALLELAAPLL